MRERSGRTVPEGARAGKRANIMAMTNSSGPQVSRLGPNAHDDFYRALGYALVAFTEIDGSLFALFYAFTVGRTPDIDAAKRIFYESWNFSARLNVVARVVEEQIVDSALRHEWEEIRAAVETLKDQRNLLAHSSAASSFDVVDSIGLVLVPTFSLSGDKFTQANERLDTRHIVALAVEFEDMADRIAEFLEKIAPDRDRVRPRAGSTNATRRRRRRA